MNERCERSESNERCERSLDEGAHDGEGALGAQSVAAQLEARWLQCGPIEDGRGEQGGVGGADVLSAEVEVGAEAVGELGDGHAPLVDPKIPDGRPWKVSGRFVEGRGRFEPLVDAKVPDGDGRRVAGGAHGRAE